MKASIASQDLPRGPSSGSPGASVLADRGAVFHGIVMTTSLDQALLYFVDLRLQVRGNPTARAIVDRCLALLAAARTADAETMARLEAEVEELRALLRESLGDPRPFAVH